jgi:hypothetical protein
LSVQIGLRVAGQVRLHLERIPLVREGRRDRPARPPLAIEFVEHTVEPTAEVVHGSETGEGFVVIPAKQHGSSPDEMRARDTRTTNADVDRTRGRGPRAGSVALPGTPPWASRLD